MACTVVTAFYPIKSKFPSTKYFEWAHTFMKLSSPIILFTDASLTALFKSMRGDKPIFIVELPFDELDTWKLYENKWKAHWHIDPEKHIHTPELYAIWAQKVFFVERAIELNVFSTDYFFWCDIGAFRNPSISNVILNSFPTTHFMKYEKLILQAIGIIPESEKTMKDDGIFGEPINYKWNECRLVGGLWGGSTTACIQWKKSYQETLEKYFSANRFAGKDQAVMLSTYLANPILANIVRSTKTGIDNWFFLEHLLSDEKNTYLLDESYTVVAKS